MNEPKFSLTQTQPDYNISFHRDNELIGKLDFNGPKMVFTGDAEESAEVFVEWIAKSFERRFKEEREAEREGCITAINNIKPHRNWVTREEAIEAIRARGSKA